MDLTLLKSMHNFTYDVGLLQVTNIENTLLLSGIQTHVIVLCILQKN